MADLTSIISISGNVGGKSISFTHTYTMEEVSDAGAVFGATDGRTDGASPAQSGLRQIRTRSGEINFLTAQNKSTKVPSFIGLNPSGIGCALSLLPGQSVVLFSLDAGGLYGESSTAGDTATSVVETVVTLAIPMFKFLPPTNIMVANYAAS